MAKKINVMLTAFRDGFQSVYGARVLRKDFLPAVQAFKEAGVTHFEAGGGAIFQSQYFYCNEDAFETMDEFRKTVGPDINLQTLSRGTNVVGLESQSSDIINLHAKMFKKHGITTIRNFDALCDVNNLIYSGQCIKKNGLRHEVVIAMMSIPPFWEGYGKVHTPEFYTNLLKQILDAGIEFDSVCYKDASGTSTPKTVFNTIKAARKLLGPDMPIVFHSHDTAGTAIDCYVSAIEAGASQVDLSAAPVSGGTSQPDIISLWHALRETDYDLGFGIEKIMQAEEVFKDCMKDYFIPPESKAVEPLIPFSPMPGGALTANTQMMRDQGIMNKYPDVIREMGDVVKLGGFGTSVTPVSQFYFQQAFNNVMLGKWKKIADGFGKMVLGYFGKTPLPPAPEIVKIASEQLQLEPTTKMPLEINDADPKKGIAPAKKMLEDNGLPTTEENIFIAATCKEKGIDFLKGKGKVSIRKNEPAAKEAGPKQTSFVINIEGEKFNVNINDGKATVNGKVYSYGIDGSAAPAAANAAPASAGKAVELKAQLAGSVYKIIKNAGDHVKEGDNIIILEAMKMEIEIKSPVTGTVKSIEVAQGAQVANEQLLAYITQA